MKLPIPFLNSKKKDNNYYLTLLLSDEKATAVILEESGGILTTISKHSEFFTEHLETISQDNLISLVDKTVSRAEEVLPPDIETHKTIFGVKELWVEKDTKKIKKEHLTKLKKVCDALSLTPIGFMVVSEAIANLLQLEEGAPLSAILVELSQKTVNVTLFRGGKISESLHSPLDHSAPVAVDNLLKHFIASVLPTKIILFHPKESKNLVQNFTNHEWSKSLPFLHVPQITALSPDFDTKAVTYGAGQQMGFEISGLSSTGVPSDQASETDKSVPKKEESEESEHEAEVSNSDFGFVVNEDVADESAKEISNNEPGTASIAESKPIHNQPFQDHSIAEIEPIESINDDPPIKHQLTHKNALFASLTSFIPLSAFKKFPKLSGLLSKNKGLKLPLIIGGGVLILIILLSLFYLNSASAEVVLSVRPRVVKQDANITFSTSGASDFSKNIIAAKSVSTSVDGEISTAATGKKDTGDKAKGNVTIFNSSDSPANLSSGTVIKSSNGLSFTLDKEIKVASASGDIFSGTKPGTAQVGVSASEIGTESNLPSNTKFTVGGNSDLAGKNDSAFSGGTKKAITVVSKTDLERLRSELQKSLEEKAIEELSKKSDDSEIVLPGFVSKSIENPEFDKDMDDEAKEVKLSASVEFESMSYQKEDLENYGKTILKENNSDDISFADKSIKAEVINPKVNDDEEMEAEVSITAGLLPKIDNEEVVNKLKNKSAKQAEEILSELPQVTKSEIKFRPSILFLARLFPRLPKNLSITVQSDE